METQHIQYLIAAIVVLAVIYLVLRKRASNLRIHIETVPPDRIDNTPIERNEIVSEVRVRTREQAAAKSAALNAEQTRIEPTVNKAGASEVSADTASGTATFTQSTVTLTRAAVLEERPLTFYPGYDAAKITSEPNEPAPIGTDTASPFTAMPTLPADVAPAVAHAQNDLFPDAESVELALGGINETELAFDRVISIHVMARDTAIPGRLLLEHLLQYGLRYGDMAIFHRHEHPTGQGSILFSLAQAMEPGTFDIDTLSRDSVPGVSLFLGLPGYKCLVAYDLMIDTARRLASALKADMLDDNGQVLTAGKLADWRDEVVSFDTRTTSV